VADDGSGRQSVGRAAYLRTTGGTGRGDPGIQHLLIDGPVWTLGEVAQLAFVNAKPVPEVFLGFDWIIAQLARRKELDLASSAHGQAWRSVFALEDHKSKFVHSGR